MNQRAPSNIVPDPRRRLGQQGEAFVASTLTRAGYTVLDRNWRLTGVGELDIVARQGDEIVFVEVRTRRGPVSTAIALALESIGPRKQARLAQLAEAYLAAHDLNDMAWRVDVAAVGCTSGTFALEIIQHALNW
ncbi:YraN family protein [Aggregatilinea lenta]|uniref:YraN family protein n=1 Tax=Aggregatilinea lenta TaxID=913108 RepID=UPI000E5A71CC|nr:YraN family protein [Aggregatilinea lenta]